MNKTILIFVGVVIVIVGSYFLLKGSYQTPTIETTTTTTPATATEVSEINVSGTEFSFSPSSISIKAGEQVKITFKNNGKAIHNFTLDKLGVATKTVSSGKTEVLEFTAPSSGTYAFFCSVSGHRASGMEGSLKVE